MRLLLLLLLLVAAAYPRLATAQGTLGTLTVGPYQSNAQGVLTGAYVPTAKLPTQVSYLNTSGQVQDSLAFTGQVLGNGYAAGFQLFTSRLQGLGPGAKRTYALGDVELPGPGSYLVQLSAFTYERSTTKWVSGPVRIYWLFPLARPLPVELVSFQAAAAADSVKLAWETATERQCQYFEVQRSTNGSTWYPRTRVVGHGTTPLAHRYRYTEYQLMVRVYYRLRQVDDDGSEHFSPVVALAPTPVATAVATISVYPNPAQGSAQVTAPAGVLVTFYDEAGRQRRQQTLDATTTLDLRGLPAGSYHLVVGTGPRASRTRLVVF